MFTWCHSSRYNANGNGGNLTGRCLNVNCAEVCIPSIILVVSCYWCSDSCKLWWAYLIMYGENRHLTNQGQWFRCVVEGLRFIRLGSIAMESSCSAQCCNKGWRPVYRYWVPIHVWCALIGSRSGSHLQTTTPPSHPLLSRLAINLLFQRHGVWCWQERLSNTGSWEDLGRSRDEEKSKCPTTKGLRVSPQYVIIQCTSLGSWNQPIRREGSNPIDSPVIYSYDCGSKLCPPFRCWPSWIYLIHQIPMLHYVPYYDLTVCQGYRVAVFDVTGRKTSETLSVIFHFTHKTAGQESGKFYSDLRNASSLALTKYHCVNCRCSTVTRPIKLSSYTT